MVIMSSAQYPSLRMRRLRSQDWIRDLVCEHHVRTSDLIWPLFITEGQNQREPIKSLPGVERLSIDLAIQSIKQAADWGIKAIALFPATPQDKKNENGKEALNPKNLICTAISEIKKQVPHIGIIADVALDPYTSHGHDGLLKGGKILNDETVEVLCKQALTLASAGADIIAPSDMMDGRIGAIRATLESKKHHDVMILSYAAKFASSFYGPFRDAVGSSGVLQGNKKTYQMNPANAQEALREVALDIAEGADMVMVKPGLPYLDIIQRIKSEHNIPVFAYHVSGEFAMLKAAAANGWLNYEDVLMETLLAFKRAGSNAILTYGAYDLARLLCGR